MKIAADEFWIAPALRTHYLDSDGMEARWVEIVEPDWLAGAVAQPGPHGSERCEIEHPSAEVVCPLIAGHDGPHWKAARSALPYLSLPIQIIKGEEYPDVWLLCGRHPWSPLFSDRPRRTA